MTTSPPARRNWAHSCSPPAPLTAAARPGPPPPRLRRARRRDVSTTTELTAQERQVAALVRQGLSNRAAAAQLFVSPRTGDFHLRNIFGKLGVTSRAELTVLPLDL
ncbi:helix-turn-helix transcriptional regulator [Pseudonocardia sp. RS11V-5]|uniref:helix-turn-helix domain-containing protein n=1 Tax=Pseudonocardia terrae TaxID=2905831 RepID=UPI001E2F92B0|nr:helix-turn-helix transcriptional regulator [Pseudonocardia terrae]MCE3551818.1 helix-turn-helix transcriptional regulator [Pseudonocardia terrae]